VQPDAQGLTAPRQTTTPAELAGAARVLSALGLVSAFGHVSARAGDRVLVTPAADLAEVTAGDLVEVAVGAGVLPAGAPAETWIHLAVYRRRPDVTAIARAQPPAAFAAAAAAPRLYPLHGQACWLGREVPVHDDARLLRSPGLAASAADTLADADTLLLRGNGAVTTGTSPGLAVTRMWLLAAACRVWLAAPETGRSNPLRSGEVDSWRAVQDELLPRLWRYLRRTAGDPAHPPGGSRDD
jgi:HCOMODA/2-hydroxy-3-carboxy-muconic semialdehyde decarboxylase